MMAAFARFVAILLLVIPGFAATYGLIAMKDAIFAQFDGEHASMPWGKFIVGFLLFVAGTGLIGGWIFYRDRKRNYVAPRFKQKKR